MEPLELRIRQASQVRMAPLLVKAATQWVFTVRKNIIRLTAYPEMAPPPFVKAA